MFFKVARPGQNQWYWYILGLLVVFFIGTTIGSIPLIIVTFLKVGGSESLSSITQFSDALNNTLSALANPIEAMLVFNNDKNLFLLLQLLGFVGGALFLWLWIKFVHKRRFTTLLTAAPKFRWNRFWFAFGIIALALIAFTVFGYYSAPEDYIVQFELRKWIPLFLIGLIFLFIQTGFEEWIFRGYLMQGLGELTKTRWFPLVVTSVMFGLMHGLNPEVMEHGFFKMMPYYVGVGLFLGVVTLLDNGLELAWGYHFANNFIGSLLITAPESALQTNSILRTKEPMDPVGELLPMFATLVVALGIFWFRYRWKNWGNLLAGTVDKTSVIHSHGQPRLA